MVQKGTFHIYFIGENVVSKWKSLTINTALNFLIKVSRIANKYNKNLPFIWLSNRMCENMFII